jgi:hypothetical protein
MSRPSWHGRLAGVPMLSVSAGLTGGYTPGHELPEHRWPAAGGPENPR